MKKKQIKFPQTPKNATYFLNRKCEYCGKPIEDQATATRKHCLPWIDEFGVKHSCKRLKHTVKHEREDQILLEYNGRAKSHNKMIAKMLTDHGDVVTSQIIDSYGITLTDAISIEVDIHQWIFHFIDFTIISNPNTHTHQIVVTKDQKVIFNS